MTLDKKTLRNIFIVLAACIGLYWLLHATERVWSVIEFVTGLFTPFVVGAAIAFIFNVPMRGIEKRLKFVKKSGLRRTISVLLTFVILVLVLTAVFWLLLPQIGETIGNLISRLPAFFSGALEKLKAFLRDNPELMEWVENNTDLKAINWSELVQKIATFIGNSFSAILVGTFAAIGNVSTGIFNGVIAIVFAIYCLFRKEILARQARRILYAFLPEKFCDESIRILRLTNTTFSNFISGQCLEACILGSMFAIAMAIFRMPYIPLVSVLVAVTALVPIVGAFVGCILGAFFILVDNPIQAVWFVVMFLVIQQIEGNIIYPRVVGKSVGLPGMWVLMAVSVGGELMGVAGMLALIPVTSVLYTLMREITTKRLEARGIDRSKLQDQPPELQSRLVGKKKKQKAPPPKKNEEPSDEKKAD